MVRRRVDVDDPVLRSHVPDQADPLLEILVKFLVHFFAGVTPADDLHGEVGDEEGNRLFGNHAARKTLQREKRNIGDSYEVDIELDGTRFASDQPQSSRPDEDIEDGQNIASNDGFF